MPFNNGDEVDWYGKFYMLTLGVIAFVYATRNNSFKDYRYPDDLIR